MVNSHKRRNNINKININHAWLTDCKEIRYGIVETFINMLSYPRNWRANLMNLKFSRINVAEAVCLKEPFTEEEVKTTLTKLNRDKALGPDGFTTTF